VPECVKLFKGVEFWRKHVEKRHTDFYQNLVDSVNLVNTYVLDPAHIAPSRSDANSNGHFPLSQNIPTGTPRNFQLNQQFGLGFPMAAGLAANGAGLPVLPPGGFGAAGVPLAWQQAAAAYAGAGVGPMRTTAGGGRNNTFVAGIPGQRMAGVVGGPYMRSDVRGLRGMRGIGMGMEGGAGAMGPREAVAGRQLRSYEDLDADKGDGGTGELNY